MDNEWIHCNLYVHHELAQFYTRKMREARCLKSTEETQAVQESVLKDLLGIRAITDGQFYNCWLQQVPGQAEACIESF